MKISSSNHHQPKYQSFSFFHTLSFVKIKKREENKTQKED